MDNQRLLIWAFFAMLAWMTYQAWQKDYGPQPAAPAPVSESVPAVPEEDPLSLPEISETDSPDTVPELPSADDQPAGMAAVMPAQAATIVSVHTDVLDLEISAQGGTLQRATLSKYPVAKDKPDIPVTLLSPEQDDIGLIRTGLRSADAERPGPGHTASFTAVRNNYDMGDDDELVVKLNWSDGAGLELEKRYRFVRGSYVIEVEQTLRNNTAEPWRGDQYAQLLRRFYEQERSMFNVDSYSFDGPIVYDGEKAEKLQRDDLLEDGPYEFTAENGWVASIQHHFLSAIAPDRGAKHIYQVQTSDIMMTASAVGAKLTVEPGNSHTFTQTLFVGPKLQEQLEQIDPRLKLTVDYGWLTILSQPLFWLLSKAFSIFGNWGVAIIAVTILIKLVFYKLTESSGRSMAKMRNLQPRLKAIQERYKDDRQQQSQAMMELYKREKVNPAAGCLPILIQMPFFLAFYWVLLESVEMRQAPFALWITDLSVRDPLFVLPLIMGAAMFLQQKLNPQVGDPVQVKVMQIMPIIFTAFFAFFPSGLVLYWVTNTVLSIAQQWKINRVVENEAKQQKGGKKPKSG
jgi:YidC/Oxa1 family membrane protein insertase